MVAVLFDDVKSNGVTVQNYKTKSKQVCLRYSNRAVTEL